MLLKATEVTALSCIYRLAIYVLVSMFQSLIVLSSDPLARIAPVLLNVTEVTLSSCPFRVVISVLVSTFQSLIVLSSDPLARIVPV